MKLNRLIRRFSLLLFTLFCWFSMDLQAQVRIGPKAGFQMARSVFQDKDYLQDYSSSFKPGMLLGGVLNYRVNQTYSLHTELFYNQKGKAIKNHSGGDFVKNSTTYHYVDLPILLRLSKHGTHKGNKIEYYFNIGPSFNYWLGGHGRMVNNELDEFIDDNRMQYRIRFYDGDEHLDYGSTLYVSEAKRLQMSLDFGAGVVMDLGGGRGIMIDLRNSLGIGKAYMGHRRSGDFGLFSYDDNFASLNHVFSLSVAYLIDVDIQAFVQKGRRRR